MFNYYTQASVNFIVGFNYRNFELFQKIILLQLKQSWPTQEVYKISNRRLIKGETLSLPDNSSNILLLTLTRTLLILTQQNDSF